MGRVAFSVHTPSCRTPEAALGETVLAFSTQACVLQDSRFEVSKNGTLRINSVEVYDGTLYRCVSSTPAGSIEAQARVQVLGELRVGLACLGRGVMGKARQGWPGLSPCLSCFFSPSPPNQKNSSSRHHRSHSSAWSLIRKLRCPAQPLAERSPQLGGYGQVSTAQRR